jgi:hypothetical protein
MREGEIDKLRSLPDGFKAKNADYILKIQTIQIFSEAEMQQTNKKLSREMP